MQQGEEVWEVGKAMEVEMEEVVGALQEMTHNDRLQMSSRVSFLLQGAQKDSRVGSDGAAVQRFELDAVKRLLREIFADFVVMRGRLDTIESIT
eukprot:gene24278-29490_t